MKVLVIAALLALLLLLLYSRIYPYLQALKKIFGVAKTITSSPGSTGPAGSTSRGSGKLVRCEGCGTWIPANRAIGLKSGQTVFCSRECIEKTSSRPNMKIVG